MKLWFFAALAVAVSCKSEVRAVEPLEPVTPVVPLAPAAAVAPVAPLADDAKNDWTPVGVALTDPTTWPRATSRQFGCLLEKHGQRPRAFHCTSAKPAEGDPCQDTEPYYAGPAFPEALVAQVRRDLAGIEISWEHGDLQSVTLVFKPGVDEAAIEAAFPPSPLPKNVSSRSVQHCSKDSWCLLLQGFDHMGAGDVDCEGEAP